MMTSTIDWGRTGSLVILLMAAASAQALPLETLELHPPRVIHVSKEPAQKVPDIFVAGEQVTTLRFETPCDLERTKLLGWEGRFEPLLVGNGTVVVVPLRDLDSEDRIVLLVTLVDGTEVPFTLRARPPYWDGQVNVFLDPDSSRAVRATLETTRKENRALREENLRREKEETSADHALAALLAGGQVSMTPFKQTQKWALQDEGIAADVIILEGAGRTAVVLQMKNLDVERPWRLQEARLLTWTNSEERPFAVRMAPTELQPGERGCIAVVTDTASFKTKEGKDKLVLELFRDGGLRQAYLVLENRRIKR